MLNLKSQTLSMSVKYYYSPGSKGGNIISIKLQASVSMPLYCEWSSIYIVQELGGMSSPSLYKQDHFVVFWLRSSALYKQENWGPERGSDSPVSHSRIGWTPDFWSQILRHFSTSPQSHLRPQAPLQCILKWDKILTFTCIYYKMWYYSTVYIIKYI